MLKVRLTTIVIEDSVIYAKDDPSRKLRLAELAHYVYQNSSLLPEEVDAGLEVTAIGSMPKAFEAFISKPQYEIGVLLSWSMAMNHPLGT